MSVVDIRNDGDVAVITIDNPPVNALRHAVRLGLKETLAKAEADAGTRAVVIACAGRTFVAGADITEFGKPMQPPGLREVAARHRGHVEAGGRGHPRHRARRRAGAGARLPLPRRRSQRALRVAGSEARHPARRRRHATAAARDRARGSAAHDRHRRDDPGQEGAGARPHRRDRREGSACELRSRSRASSLPRSAR